MKSASFILPAVIVGLVASGVAAIQQRALPTPEVSATATATINAAKAFLASLSPELRAKAAFPFDSPQKTNWSNLPSGIFERHSLRLGDLSAPQRESVMALLRAVLSRDGYTKVVNIMNGDEVLKQQGGGRTGGRPGQPGGGAAGAAARGDGNRGNDRAGGPPAGGGGRRGGGGGVVFGKDEYYIAILGEPSVTLPWMIQFGGHHLGINVTIRASQSVMTPSLPAAQPATYTLDGQTIRPLGNENDKGFALINALSDEQKKQAILTYKVNDLVLGPTQDGKTIQPEGIRASALTPAQQNMLLDIAHEWVGILNDEGASTRMAEIRGNLAQTWFAWSGSTRNGELAYYRIQGPTVLIEYAPQQGDLDHIHTIYRDPTNDYGAKLTAR